MPSKYDALVRYLAAQSGDRVVLTLAEIETIIGAPLPSAAWARGWWVNSRRASQAWVWRDAGWSVASATVRTREPVVTFARDIADGTPAGLP